MAGAAHELECPSLRKTMQQQEHVVGRSSRYFSTLGAPNNLVGAVGSEQHFFSKRWDALNSETDLTWKTAEHLDRANQALLNLGRTLTECKQLFDCSPAGARVWSDDIKAVIYDAMSVLRVGVLQASVVDNYFVAPTLPQTLVSADVARNATGEQLQVNGDYAEAPAKPVTDRTALLEQERQLTSIRGRPISAHLKKKQETDTFLPFVRATICLAILFYIVDFSTWKLRNLGTSQPSTNLICILIDSVWKPVVHQSAIASDRLDIHSSELWAFLSQMVFSSIMPLFAVVLHVNKDRWNIQVVIRHRAQFIFSIIPTTMLIIFSGVNAHLVWMNGGNFLRAILQLVVDALAYINMIYFWGTEFRSTVVATTARYKYRLFVCRCVVLLFHLNNLLSIVIYNTIKTTTTPLDKFSFAIYATENYTLFEVGPAE